MRTIYQVGDLAGKRVLVRNDFNITIDDSEKILDDFRIRASLPTIKFLMERGAKIILASHLGRPEGNVVERLRLKPVQKRLSELIGMEIKLAPDCVGSKI